jgi:hypothetical protein
MWTTSRRIAGLAPLLMLSAGCVITPPPTTVELVNTTSLDVRPHLYASDSADDAAGLFVGANVITDFTDRAIPELRAGETVTLTFDCDALRALGVDAPVLFDAVQLLVTRSNDRLLLRREVDFQCGDTVRFVYYREGEAFRVRAELP